MKCKDYILIWEYVLFIFGLGKFVLPALCWISCFLTTNDNALNNLLLLENDTGTDIINMSYQNTYDIVVNALLSGIDTNHNIIPYFHYTNMTS